MVSDSPIPPRYFITNKTATSSTVNQNCGWYTFDRGGKFQKRRGRWSFEVDGGEKLSCEVVSNEMKVGSGRRRGLRI